MQHTIHSRIARSAAVSALAFFVAVAPALAAKPLGTFSGIVRHVSVSNIKVYNPKTQKTMGFAIESHFHNIFKRGKSKTTQLATIAPGQYVKVYFDRKLLGAARARTIYLLDQNNNAYYKQ